jgi:hypothetical protein
MFRGLSQSDYPDPGLLVDVLLGAVARLNDCGAVNLTPDDAARLREGGYTAILGPGWYQLPRISIDLLRPHPSLANLAFYWYGPRAFDSPASDDFRPRTVRPADAANLLRWRLGQALSISDQRRVLDAVAHRPECGVMRRRLQQNLRRLPAARFSPSLMALIKAGLVAQQDDRRLTLDPEVRRLLLEAGCYVRRSPSARAMRRERTERTGETCAPRGQRGARDSQRHGQLQQSDRTTKRRYQRRPIPDRRRFPRQWGYSMRARLGGLTRQRQCRRLGVNPTAAATAARQAKQAREKRRHLVLSESTTSAAPVMRMVAPEAPSNARTSGVAPSMTASAISDALAYNQPIGRRQRLAAERNRR